MKWRHTDGGSAADTEALHVLLRRIEHQLGELGTGVWGADVLTTGIQVQSNKGSMVIELPSKFRRRTCDWIIDAVIARKQLRKKLNDPAFGASK